MRPAPERVDALALISTSARPDSPEQLASRREQQRAVAAGRSSELVEQVFAVLVDPGNIGRADLADRWRTTAREVGPEAYLSQLEATMTRPDSRPAVETSHAIMGSHLTLVPDAGHMIAQEQPEALAIAVGELGSVVAGRDRPGRSRTTQKSRRSRVTGGLWRTRELWTWVQRMASSSAWPRMRAPAGKAAGFGSGVVESDEGPGGFGGEPLGAGRDDEPGPLARAGRAGRRRFRRGGAAHRFSPPVGTWSMCARGACSVRPSRADRVGRAAARAGRAGVCATRAGSRRRERRPAAGC